MKTQLLNLIVSFSAFVIPAFMYGQDSSVPVKDVMTHDPVMIVEDGKYYLFSTGNGISVMSSRDMLDWQFEKPVFDNPPQWAVDMIDGYKGHTWAPDIIYHDGLYHLFYSCSAFGKNTSAIGHATNKTLNPDSPDFKWVDHGPVIQSVPNRDAWNAIDPNLIIDDSGTPWMAFGSFWDGIKMVRLSDDMNTVCEPQEWYSLSRRKNPAEASGEEAGDNAVEAPFIIKHNDFYYLFVSFDYCCRGLDSDYKVVVGRSKEVCGPYLDRNGKPMEHGGGTLVIEGNDEYAGIGHCAAYKFGDKYYFVSHAYSIKENGTPKLFLREMKWTSDGWPEI